MDKDTNLSENDIRRNTIVKLLSDWGLVTMKGTFKLLSTTKSNQNHCFQRKK